jgi:AbrB family looped-hinge helix DNA binding protein
MNLTPIDSGRRIQLPAEWADALGLRDMVALERTDDGILVRPAPRATWDEIFADKLIIGSAPPDENEDDLELTGDDFLF